MRIYVKAKKGITCFALYTCNFDIPGTTESCLVHIRVIWLDPFVPLACCSGLLG